jgi:4a-hydroxytetrahydrobiopterin dehydratase
MNKKIIREYSFPDFKSALDFVKRIGRIAERYNHHPEIFLAWGKVRVELYTHKLNKVTNKDIQISLRFDEAYNA